MTPQHILYLAPRLPKLSETFVYRELFALRAAGLCVSAASVHPPERGLGSDALERLADQNKISVSDMGSGSAVFEAVSEGMHHHLVCQKCGQVFTIENQDVEQFFDGIQKKNQFQIHTNHLILFGLCAGCQGAETG